MAEVEVDFGEIWQRFVNNWKGVFACSIIAIAIIVGFLIPKIEIQQTKTIVEEKIVEKEVIKYETIEVYEPTDSSIEFLPDTYGLTLGDVYLPWSDNVDKPITVGLNIKVHDRKDADSYIASIGGKDAFHDMLRQVIVSEYGERSRQVPYRDFVKHAEYIAKGEDTKFMDADIWDAFDPVGIYIYHSLIY